MNSSKSNQYIRQKRPRSKKKKLKILRNRIIFAVVVLGIFCAIGYIINTVIAYVKGPSEPPQQNEAIHVRQFLTDRDLKFDGHYQATFNDLQETQIVAAQAMGIIPLDSHEAIDTLLKDGRLVKVHECTFYETELTELPYLTPEAKTLLDVIAVRFRQRSATTDKLRITGCLRTNEFVSKLKRVNVNSVQNSCHLYGTTFDISYRYLQQDEKKVLAQILYELQQAGHCYVKYERKQPCFHITLRPDPEAKP